MLKVETTTGSTYLFDMENLKVIRLDHTDQSPDMRKDGEWLQMLVQPVVELNQCIRIPLEPLSGLDTDICTVRLTSPVESIEEYHGEH